MNTLLLDRVTWDLCKDASGNIAVAQTPYATAQDAASATRLFLGEAWYDTSQGVPYSQQILGRWPPISLVKTLIAQQAETVPGVESAAVFISGAAGRALTGQMQVVANGETLTIGVGWPPLT